MSNSIFSAGDTVRALVPVKMEGSDFTNPAGFRYIIKKSNDDGTVIVNRDGMSATVKQTDIEFAYKVVNGISYSSRTSPEVINVLEECRRNGTYIHVHYGFTEHSEEVKDDPELLGKEWLEENGVEGRIGNSTGHIKIPLLVPRNGDGGPGLLDDSIVKITTVGKNRHVLYIHPNYHHGEIRVRKIYDPKLNELGYVLALDVDGKNHANFKSQNSLKKFISKMNLTVEDLSEIEDVEAVPTLDKVATSMTLDVVAASVAAAVFFSTSRQVKELHAAIDEVANCSCNKRAFAKARDRLRLALDVGQESGD